MGSSDQASKRLIIRLLLLAVSLVLVAAVVAVIFQDNPALPLFASLVTVGLTGILLVVSLAGLSTEPTPAQESSEPALVLTRRPGREPGRDRARPFHLGPHGLLA